MRITLMALFLMSFVNSFQHRFLSVRSRNRFPIVFKSVTQNNDGFEEVKDRPFTLPPGEFRPKQSLGQNFLSDQNYVMKIVNAFKDVSEDGIRVVELGPGPGALTRKLHQKYPKMSAVEIDQRAVAFLGEKIPGLKVIHKDVLECDWPLMATERGGPLSVIGNLPFYITSQILFSLADRFVTRSKSHTRTNPLYNSINISYSHKAIDHAVVTMQYEVAERIIAQVSILYSLETDLLHSSTH